MQDDLPRTRALITQRKTGTPVQFEIIEQARVSLAAWVKARDLTGSGWLFPSRIDVKKPMTTRQYARLLDEWIGAVGLSPAVYGTHSLRRTNATLIYRKTGNIRAVQLLLTQSLIAPSDTLAGSVEDALAIVEGIDV